MCVAARTPMLALWIALAVAATGQAQELDLPASLRGKVSVRVLSCDPHAGREDLRVARVRIRVGSEALGLRDLQCGAFQPGSGQALFLNAVDGLGRLDAGSQRVVEVVFPASARYSECRCVFGGATALRESGSQAAEWWQAETLEPQAEGPDDPWSARPEIPGRTGMRRELVLRPATPVHEGAGADQPVTGRLTANQVVEVFAVQGGWKRVRSDLGVAGWIRSDAATADLDAPYRVGTFLNDLAAELRESRRSARTLLESCPVSAAEALPELVFSLLQDIRTVYVTNLWYALDDVQRQAFHAWVSGCHDIRRIVEMESGAELVGGRWVDPLDQRAQEPASLR